MAQKTATLYMRIELGVKERAEAILEELGIPASSAVNMFYKQVILRRGLPFDVSLPARRQPDATQMIHEELMANLNKGYADVKGDRTRPAAAVFALLDEEYGA